jgi:hypothetical protein
MGIESISRDWGVSPSIVRITTTDNLSTITAAGYITTQNQNINDVNHGDFEWADGDLVAIDYNGGEDYFTRDAVNNTFILNMIPPASLPLTNAHIFVGNALNVATDVAMTGDVAISNAGLTTIQNHAVTAAKMANATITTTQISATAGIVGTQLAAGTVTGTQIASNTVGDAEIAQNMLQYISVPMTAAEWNGMYAAPFLMFLAGGAHTLITINQVAIEVIYGSAQFTAGGVVALQYDSTANGAGVPASDTIAAATVTGWAANTIIGVTGAISNGASAAIVNKGIYISNQTAAFATGDSTFLLHIWYSISSTTL